MYEYWGMARPATLGAWGRPQEPLRPHSAWRGSETSRRSAEGGAGGGRVPSVPRRSTRRCRASKVDDHGFWPAAPGLRGFPAPTAMNRRKLGLQGGNIIMNGLMGLHQVDRLIRLVPSPILKNDESLLRIASHQSIAPSSFLVIVQCQGLSVSLTEKGCALTACPPAA